MFAAMSTSTGGHLMSMTEPIRDKRQVKGISDYFLDRGETRNNALFIMGVYTALRISDLLRLKWEAVYDFERQTLREKIIVTEKKTGKKKIVALNPAVITALKMCLNVEKGKPIFINNQTGNAISRVQAYRIIRAASEAVVTTTHYSCHSLRKTLGYHSWKKGVSPAIIMYIYNHSSLVVTRRYLGISQDDLNAVYLGLELTA
jgi:integrase